MRRINVTRAVIVMLGVCACLSFLPGAWVGGAEKGAKAKPAASTSNESVVELSMEVWALQALHDFDFTPDQLRALRAMSENAASPIGQRDDAKVADKYVTKLTALRDALAGGKDDDEIDGLRDEVDAMQDDDDNAADIDDSVTISDTARTKAPLALKLFSSSQIASYIAAYEDEAPDPVQSLMDAADDIRGTDDEDARDVVADAADEVGPLVAGLDAARQKPVQEKVRSFLERARKMKEGDFKSKRAELEKSAKDVVGDVDGVTILRHWMERDMAELMSNPRLAKAIDARLKAPTPSEKE
jgi:hypothetical protein